MQAQKEAPPDMQCKDKFLLQSVKTVDGTSPKDITPEIVCVVLVAFAFSFDFFCYLELQDLLCCLGLASSTRRRDMWLRRAN